MKIKNSIYIIGEGITEKYYFQHLKKIKGYRYSIRPRFFSGNTSIFLLEKKVQEMLDVGVMVICVFDADVTDRNNVERQKMESFKKRFQKFNNLIICDTLPSIEFWFLLHYKLTNKKFSSYQELEKEVIKFIPDYMKSEKFLKNESWVVDLVGRIDYAMKNSLLCANRNSSYSNIYKAINYLEKH
ncbi:MAG: hypothetical protein C0593_04005 [Marinilabiliales bacterium]|nr:MAG: hypothetical protein C0593_04005 [Marinilabiliales bacterium]